MDKGIKELDRFIRDKVSDIEFSGEKDGWELLNYQLKHKAKAKQRNRVVAIVFSFLLVASGIFFLSMPSEKNKNHLETTGSNSEKHTSLPSSANSFENTEVKKSNLPKSESKNISSQAREKEQKVFPSEEQSNALNEPGNNVGTEPITETTDESASKENYSDEELSSLVNSSSWESDLFKIEITNVGKEVNSVYSDFAPIISADGATMFFTSRRPVTKKETKQGRQDMEHVYICSLNSKKSKWANTFMLTDIINIAGRNNSVIWLSNDGQRMLLYRDDIFGNGDIYESVLDGTDWSAPVLMAAPVNTKYHESSACISPDGKTLYFVSDRPGGTGGRDIWYCTLDANGKWSNATNLGFLVNTPQDEEGIFIHPDGKTIYFSSKGHHGLGGYDVYRTVRAEDGKWSSPVNLGAPLNTPGDDVYFVMEPNGTVGYYASTRPDSNGEKDIYKVTFLWVRDKHVTSK